VNEFTDGNGVDLAFDASYSEAGFVEVKRYIGKTINGTGEEINRVLNGMREGRGVSGKVAVKLGH
jgi:hypothetical protein